MLTPPALSLITAGSAGELCRAFPRLDFDWQRQSLPLDLGFAVCRSNLSN
jgi:hypothetical protein